ncbi:MOSC domain-containing protein [Nocardioides sp. J2M5]|uniref:MOSC domain-containing protein n=1 Tax=Nocardioides palaemonis TaxID=2829810 RepID=UPI001BA45944|nr:MOSC domain-containing protein [Nocardioides palaemonis]MBS2936606.1 MOSC domain-containing protein [Nocardioides palaemonis]
MTDSLVVVSAGFSPVKGMRHLPRPGLALDELGAVGDRQWCLLDVDAARVLRTVQHPSLIGVVAEQDGDGLAVLLPDGTGASFEPEPTGETLPCDYWGRTVELALTDGPHSELLSDYLGRPVQLAAAPRGAVVFDAPVTLLGTATLADLAARLDRPSLVSEDARFRSTLVVETSEPYVEDTWLGRTVTVGSAVLRIGGPVPRCAVIDHHPETGARDLRLLKALVSHRPVNAANEPVLGVYASVVRPGVVG